MVWVQLCLEALNGGCEIVAWNRLHCLWTGCKRHVYSFSLQKDNRVKMNAGPRASRQPVFYWDMQSPHDIHTCSSSGNGAAAQHWLVTQRLLFGSAIFLSAAEHVVKLNIFLLSLWLYVLFQSCILGFPFWDHCIYNHCNSPPSDSLHCVAGAIQFVLLSLISRYCRYWNWHSDKISLVSLLGYQCET